MCYTYGFWELRVYLCTFVIHFNNHVTYFAYAIAYFQVRMSFGSRELHVFNSLYIRFTFQQLWWSSFPDIVWEQLARVVSHPLSICYTYTTTQFNYYGARQPIINVDWKKDRKSVNTSESRYNENSNWTEQHETKKSWARALMLFIFFPICHLVYVILTFSTLPT